MCDPVDHTILLVSTVFLLVFINILLVESLLYKKEPNNSSQEQSPEKSLKIVSRTLQIFLGILYDKKLWHFGERDARNIFTPTWTEGGFLKSSLPDLKSSYFLLRNTSKSSDTYSILSFLLYYIRLRSKSEIKQQKLYNSEHIISVEESEAVSHYAHVLIYYVLEKEYLENEENAGIISTENSDIPTFIVDGKTYLKLTNNGYERKVDISIKIHLTSRDSPWFYGELFPYFDLTREALMNIPSDKRVKYFVKLVVNINVKIHKLAKYLFFIIIFWFENTHSNFENQREAVGRTY